MDIVSLFENLAVTVHHKPILSELLDALPAEINLSYKDNNSQRIRENMADSKVFPDAKIVAI